MADYFYENGKKCYKNQYHSYSSQKEHKCFVETHTISGSGVNLTGNIPLDFFLRPNTSRTIFEDFTKNHNKTLIQISAAGNSAPFDVTIRTRGSRIPITARLSEDDSPQIFQVEDFESLTFSNTTNSPSVGNIFIQKTFCICCNEKDNSCNECDYEG
ncbi:exosporium protein D [Bacillus arachidis]|uniref:Exosporium protein D n=1 Tax=Bacillus arachidis TaxID=2819290 RepID=A0ABS3NWN4_9BACI|nr:exosporium protein D [Bacillus arachidis]MBO1624975.1 exosporium protein D [Bacillus arachidis]